VGAICIPGDVGQFLAATAGEFLTLVRKPITVIVELFVKAKGLLTWLIRKLKSPTYTTRRDRGEAKA